MDLRERSMSSLGNTRGKDGSHRTDNLTGFARMKKIEAIIVPGKLDAVRLELERRGINATLTLIKVQQGEGQNAPSAPQAEAVGSFTDRLKVELIVGERQVQKAVDIITQYGQVALLRVNEVLQIMPPLTNI
jgi:nitrogen regulatory protein PII